jgi:hypothetical protein
MTPPYLERSLLASAAASPSCVRAKNARQGSKQNNDPVHEAKTTASTKRCRSAPLDRSIAVSPDALVQQSATFTFSALLLFVHTTIAFVQLLFHRCTG